LQLQLQEAGPLPVLYPADTVVGNGTYAGTFVRLRNGLVGSVGAVDLAVGGQGAGSTLSQFALAAINAGNTSLNSSCIPQARTLPVSFFSASHADRAPP